MLFLPILIAMHISAIRRCHHIEMAPAWTWEFNALYVLGYDPVYHCYLPNAPQQLQPITAHSGVLWEMARESI